MSYNQVREGRFYSMEDTSTRDERASLGDTRRRSKHAYSMKAQHLSFLAAHARDGFAENVGMSQDAYAQLPRATPVERARAKLADQVKVKYYASLVVTEMAKQLGVDEDSLVCKLHSTVAEAERAAEDDGGDDVSRLTVNFNAIARLLSPAQLDGRTTASNGNVLVQDILHRARIDMTWFVPSRKGSEARRRHLEIRINDKLTCARRPEASVAEVKKSKDKMIADGLLHPGELLPSRVARHVQTQEGWVTCEVDEPGRIVPIHSAISRRLAELERKGHLRVHLPLWDVSPDSDMDMAEHWLKKRAQPVEHYALPMFRSALSVRGEQSRPGSPHRRILAWAEYELHRSVRSQPAPPANARSCGPTCHTCETVPHCSNCDMPSFLGCECCNAPPKVLKCNRCDRVGVRDDAAVREATAQLLENGVGCSLASSNSTLTEEWWRDTATPRDRLLRLVLLERLVEVEELLARFGEGQLERDERFSRADREALLRKHQTSDFEIAAWADGSQIVNRAFQAHTWHLMCARPHPPSVQRAASRQRRGGAHQLVEDAEHVWGCPLQTVESMSHAHAHAQVRHPKVRAHTRGAARVPPPQRLGADTQGRRHGRARARVS